MNHWADPRIATNALSFAMIYHVLLANVLINLRVKQPGTNFATREFPIFHSRGTTLCHSK